MSRRKPEPTSDPAEGWDWEVRVDDDGVFDEVVALHAYVHLERMDTGAWWMTINTGEGKSIVVWIKGRGTVTATAHVEETGRYMGGIGTARVKREHEACSGEERGDE